ncbi:MAG TPA: hypothetical protein VGE94_02090, partial [Chloroflexota bacterium]
GALGFGGPGAEPLFTQVTECWSKIGTRHARRLHLDPETSEGLRGGGQKARGGLEWRGHHLGRG